MGFCGDFHEGFREDFQDAIEFGPRLGSSIQRNERAKFAMSEGARRGVAVISE